MNDPVLFCKNLDTPINLDPQTFSILRFSKTIGHLYSPPAN